MIFCILSGKDRSLCKQGNDSHKQQEQGEYDLRTVGGVGTEAVNKLSHKIREISTSLFYIDSIIIAVKAIAKAKNNMQPDFGCAATWVFLASKAASSSTIPTDIALIIF